MLLLGCFLQVACASTVQKKRHGDRQGSSCMFKVLSFASLMTELCLVAAAAPTTSTSVLNLFSRQFQELSPRLRLMKQVKFILLDEGLLHDAKHAQRVKNTARDATWTSSKSCISRTHLSCQDGTWCQGDVEIAPKRSGAVEHRWWQQLAQSRCKYGGPIFLSAQAINA